MSYKIIDLPALGRQFNATDIIEVSADGTGSYKANIGNFTLGGTNYIFVNANGTAAQNGTALKTAYIAAQAMTPNGVAKSATNRVVILLAPGYYTFNEAVDGPLLINTAFIDFVSLSGNRDVYFSSIQIVSPLGNDTDIVLIGIDTTVNNYYTHAAFAIASSAAPNEKIIVKNCKGGNYSFSSFSSGFQGLYENCEAGAYSFCSTGDALSPPAGIVSTATGSFQNYGNIINCKASDFSFVSGIAVPAGTISNYGTIKDCICDQIKSFCYSEFRAQNLGVIENCQSLDYSFCATNDMVNTGSSLNSGKIINCIADGPGICLYGGSSFANTSALNTGLISNCYSTGVSSCVINDGASVGSNTGRILNCYIQGQGFCGEVGSNSGQIIECTASATSFCCNNPTAISGQILRCTLLADTFTVGTPSGSGRVVLGIDTTGVVNY